MLSITSGIKQNLRKLNPMSNPYKYIVVYQTNAGRKATDTKTLEQAQRFADKRRPCYIYDVERPHTIYI